MTGRRMTPAMFAALREIWDGRPARPLYSKGRTLERLRAAKLVAQRPKERPPLTRRGVHIAHALDVLRGALAAAGFVT